MQMAEASRLKIEEEAKSPEQDPDFVYYDSDSYGTDESPESLCMDSDDGQMDRSIDVFSDHNEEENKPAEKPSGPSFADQMNALGMGDTFADILKELQEEGSINTDMISDALNE